MAPTLKDGWQEKLRTLQPGWNSYAASSITEEAIACLESFSTVPTTRGGIQIEVHRDGIDLEVEISPDGRIENILIGNARTK